MHHQRVLDWLHHLPTPCDSKTHPQLSPKLPTPPLSIEASTRKRRMEEEPDDGDAAEEVTPRPTKKRRRGPLQTPNPRRGKSIFNHDSTSVSTSVSGRSRHTTSNIVGRLEVARPTIQVGPPDSDTLTIPPHALRIYNLLENTLYLTQFVPNIPDLIAGLHAMNVNIADSCLSQTTTPIKTTYGGQEQGSDGVLAVHFAATALSIVHHAQMAHDRQYNEANWYPIIRAVLSWPTFSPSDYLLAPPKRLPPSLVDVIEARDIFVSHEYLPTCANDPLSIISGVKIDHLILLNNKHPQIAAVRKQVLSGDYNWCFSPFMDSWVAKSFVVALVEAKAPGGGGGDKAESQVRLAAAAVLEAIKRVGDEEGCERGRCRTWMEEPPVVCFIVYGHSWEARVGYWESEESIRIMDPILVGNTASFVGVCRLFKVMEVLKSWAEDTYLPIIISKLRRIVKGGGEGE